MNIVIIGAGQVGASLAANLVYEHNDITVIDRDGDRLQELNQHYDLKTVQGNGARPIVLEQANIHHADMLVAVTQSDETNMVACHVADSLFKVPRKIARIRSRFYLDHPELFSPDAFHIDHVVCPEQIITEHIARMIRYPGAEQVMEFADGRVSLVLVRAYFGGPLVGHSIKTIKQHLPGIRTRLVAIYRHGRPLIPDGDTRVEDDDEVFFMATRQDIKAVLRELQRSRRSSRRLILAGGGHIGFRLAKKLQSSYQIKLIEHNPQRARFLAEELGDVTVLVGDAADDQLLREENIENTDLFCSLTEIDDTNILASLMAKHLGAKQVLALINRPAYIDLVEGRRIDTVLSPSFVTLGTFLRYIRKGDIAQVQSLRRGRAEALEAVVHGTPEQSRVSGRRVDAIPLPEGCVIGALVRDDEVIIPHHDSVVLENDHVITIITDRDQVSTVESLFLPD